MGTTVLVLGPVRIYREGLAAALQESGVVNVVGAAATPADATHCADVILLDASTEQALLIIETLAAAHPAQRIVAVGTPDDEAAIAAFAACGVTGFVTREGSVAEVLAAAEAVANGGIHCPPPVSAALLRYVNA